MLVLHKMLHAPCLELAKLFCSVSFVQAVSCFFTGSHSLQDGYHFPPVQWLKKAARCTGYIIFDDTVLRF